MNLFSPGIGRKELSEHWRLSRDGDQAALEFYHRHYSRRIYADGRAPVLFVGPGTKVVLITECGRAVFVWRKFIDGCIDQRTGIRQEGINCAIFRNEGAGLSSDLIHQADQIAWEKWPGQRHYTYVNPAKVKSANPGACFIAAGWRRCGLTKAKRLIILEILASGRKKTPTSLSGYRGPRQ